MCRISGLVNYSIPVSLKQQMVEGMCDVQKNGGPDDGGVYVSDDENVILGNRRLALLDLSSSGHQPMHYKNRLTITYNGELYNFPSLKKELQHLGHSFENHTDTEVILAAFDEWNTNSFSKLEGMFAFSLYDKQENHVYLVRDSVGIKPLYYSLANGGLSFASEVRAFKSIDYSWKENEYWQVYLMAYGHIPEPYTTYEEILSLHKGSFLKFDISTRQSHTQSFGHYNYSSQVFKDVPLTSMIRNAIEKSVGSQLLADAPLGIFLSGGIDSSILALTASKVQNKSLNCLSLYFNEEGFSEKKYQDLVLQEISCSSHQYLLSKEIFNESFPDVLKDMDLPSCDGINTWFISKYAHELGLKAVLSGIGADELFGGYPSFKRMEIAERLRLLPGFLLNSFSKSKQKKFNRLSYLNIDGIKGLYLFLRGQFNISEIARFLDADEKQVWKILNDTPVMGDVSNLENRNRASWMEFNMYMQNQLLRDADVMSMAHSVEIRVPFLDHELINLAMSVSPDVKYAGQRPKQLLIDSFRDILPEPVWNRPKMGFSFPFSNWIKNNSFVDTLMIQGDSNSRTYYNKFLNGNLHWSQMMSLIIMRSRNEE